MTATFGLTATMKIDDCQKLHQFLDGAQDQAITIDCKDVTRLGGLAAQLLLMAQKHWSATGLAFDLTNRTESFEHCINDLGFSELLMRAADA